MFTAQESALDQVHKKYGETAYTVHHRNYCLVGFKRGPKRVFSVGDTWAEAIDRLEGKARA